MIWATDSIGLSLLLYPPAPPPQLPPALPSGINACFHNWTSAVHAEISSSTLITAAGFRLDVMMSAFHSDPEYAAHCDTGGNGDVLWEGKYFGTNVHPFETVFMKTNRDLDPVLMERLTGWADKAEYTSYDYC
jgi:hypothetical protein